MEIPKYGKKSKGKRLNKDEGFVVRHFAGPVIYTTQGLFDLVSSHILILSYFFWKGFLDKNNDTIHQDLLDLLLVSQDSYFKVIHYSFPFSNYSLSKKGLFPVHESDDDIPTANRRFKVYYSFLKICFYQSMFSL